MYFLLSAITLLADAEGSGSPPPEQPSLFNPWLLAPILLIFVWLFLLRPGQKRRERDQQALHSNLNKNDKVHTIGGIIAVVHSVVDDEVVLKLEDNAKVRMLKTAIARNVSAEERLKAGTASASTTPAKTEEAAKEQKA